MVSVPFRGSCFEMLCYAFHINSPMSFPSPFGVRVLKCKDEADFRERTRRSFRPLSGFVF